MRESKTHNENSRGFSLVEVMVALLLTALVSTAAFKAFVTQHKNYMIQDDITNIQQNARASLDALTRQIRMAGYQLPNGLPPFIASNTDPDTLTVTYHVSGCNTYLNSGMMATTQDLACGSSVDCFAVGQWAYIWEADSATGEWFLISNVQPGSNQLQHTSAALSRNYGANSSVLSITQVKFYVDKSDTTHPKLMMSMLSGSPQVFADDISDLQFTYQLRNGTIVDVPANYNDVVEVLISITGRSMNPDPDLPDGKQYRYRTFSTSVMLRNQGA